MIASIASEEACQEEIVDAASESVSFCSNWSMTGCLHEWYVSEIFSESLSYKYVFTSSSFNAVDIVFRLYSSFCYSSLTEYLYGKHNSSIYIFILAAKAVNSPPLSILLGQYGMNIGSFCKEFNESTSCLDAETVVSAIIDWSPESYSYEFFVDKPSVSFLVGGSISYYDNPMRRFDGVILFSDIMSIVSFSFSLFPFTFSSGCRVVLSTVSSMSIRVIYS